MTTRVYRTLLRLYPASFRRAYGEDMVAVFEEMRRDRSPVALWWRVVVDASTSITVQRLEKFMSNRTMARPFVFALTALAVLLAAATFGAQNLPVFALTIAVASAALVASLVYWQANRSYVEPSEQLHRYWLRTLAGGVALIGLANLGSGVFEGPWLLLFLSIIAGLMLLAIGVVLGVWHAVDRVRTA